MDVRLTMVSVELTSARLSSFGRMGQQFELEFWLEVMGVGASGPVSAIVRFLISFLSPFFFG